MINSDLIAQTEEQRQFIISKTNVEELHRISDVEGRRAEARRHIAEQWAIIHGFPISGVTQDGVEFCICDYDSINQYPLYNRTTNLNAAKTTSTNKLWPLGTSGLNLDGALMTIAMWDGGAVCNLHPEFINRASAGQFETSSPFNVSPHATHVAGTLIAKGIDPYAHGMAPAANLNYYNYGNWQTEIPLEAATGTTLSNHSWAMGNYGWNFGDFVPNNWVWWSETPSFFTEYPLFGAYISFTRILDQIANDAPYFLMFRSAGNDRGYGIPANTSHYHGNQYGITCCFTDYHEINGGANGYDCMDPYACAKNSITVGAVEDIPNGYTNPSDVVLCSFSNTGPTDDGRIKPDIVTNGVQLYSTANINPITDCSNLTYFSSTGTSMSSPSAAGSAVLLQQHYSNTHAGIFMLASTTKALIIETADEAGPSNGPDYKFGWGLMNTKKAAELISKDQNDPSLIQELTLNWHISTSPQDIIDIPVTLNSLNNGYLSATIVWNDEAGTVQNYSELDSPVKRLCNDLDLRIIDPSNNVHYPWSLNPSSPASAAVQTSDNIRDNVEQVRIYGATPGTYIVRITNKPVLSTSHQDFSLIINSVPFIDLYTKDIPNDVGIEPNPEGGQIWISDDIWVRNTNDGFTNQTNQNPIFAANPNYVYVRVRNNGANSSLGSEHIALHWAKAASALSWPDYWDATYNITCGGVAPMGDLINIKTIPIIPPGGETILEFPWNVPDPNLYSSCNPEPWHFCLLSRIIAANDPMSVTEGSSVYDNAKNNNNIAWKNLTIVHMNINASNGKCFSDRVVGGTIAIGNPYNKGDDNYKIEFKLPDNFKPRILDQAEIKITLDSLSWEKWISGGYKGNNIRIKREDCRQLIITGNPASIENLTYKSMERSTIHVSFNFITEKVDNTLEFDYHVIEKSTKDNKIVGGELYRILKPVRNIFGASGGSNKSIEVGDSVTLSANSIGESAYYNWYDPQGKLIYSGTDFTASPEITTTYKLEIIALQDGFTSFDKVTVKVNEFKIESLSPNPVTDILTVQYDAENASSSYLVITLLGGASNNYILNPTLKTTTINVSNYTPGFYNVILICNGIIQDQKQLTIL